MIKNQSMSIRYLKMCVSLNQGLTYYHYSDVECDHCNMIDWVNKMSISPLERKTAEDV